MNPIPLINRVLLGAFLWALALSSAYGQPAPNQGAGREADSKSLALSSPTPIITVGAILALSGEVASAGRAVRNGIELALRNLPEEQRTSIRVVYEDDAFLPKNTISAFTKLTSVDKASTIISLGSATGNSISRLCEEAGVTLISISSDPQVSRGKRNVFTLWVTPEEETKMLLAEAARRDLKSVALITVTHDGTLAVREAFHRMNQSAINVAFDEETTSDLRDFKALLLKLKQKRFDAFMPLLFPEQLGILARQARELGFTQPFMGYETFEDEAAVKLSQGALRGAWFATYDDSDSDFLQKYRHHFPGEGTVGAGNGHDAIGLIATAAASSQAFSAENLSAYLRSVKNYRGALGTFSATGDNRFGVPATIKVVTENGFEKLRPGS